MADERMYDPLAGFKVISEMWEKRLNGLLYKMTDNQEFVQTVNTGMDVYSRYLEMLRKNQELVATLMNIPTKKDVANVAKLSVQAEGKMDVLEEEVWTLQDNIAEINKENLQIFQELIHTVVPMKAELEKIKDELGFSQTIKEELQELRQGLLDIKLIEVSLKELRKEIQSLKTRLSKKTDTNGWPEIQKDIEEIRLSAAQINELKAEIAIVKEILEKDKNSELQLASNR